MAKKIRFPLGLSDGTQARSLDELKEHFDLESALGHYKSGKLLTWFRDRDGETEADAVEALDENTPDFQQRLCAIFGVEFSGSGVDMDEIIRRQERMKKLREFTDEDEFIQNIDSVAFDQEELIDLLDEGCEKIYLCGEKFTVPASLKNKAYVGINSPKVNISGNVGDDWAERNITFAGCEVENFPQKKQTVLRPDEESTQPPLPIKPVKITISNKYAQQIKEEDNFQKSLFGDFPESFEKLLFFSSKRAKNTMSIEDVYPVFSSVFQDADVFAKLWIANQTLDKYLDYYTVDELRMKDSDRFMIMQMNRHYEDLWKLEDLDIKLIDGIPKGIRNDSYIIAKEILHKPLTEAEQERLMQIRSMFTDADKDIDDLLPIFRSIHQDLDVFAKVWLYNETSQEGLYYKEIRELHMKDSDKFVIMKMGSFYAGIWKEKKLNVTLNCGIPDNIYDDSLLIAKRIIGNFLTRAEQQQLNEMVSRFKSYKGEFYFRLANDAAAGLLVPPYK